MRDWKRIASIFLTFLKIGPVTFGGGYAMIPLIEREVVTRKKWVGVKDVTDIFAVAESCPGAIAINSSTFIGYRIAGVPGAVAAMAGVALPTFLIVVGLSVAFLFFKDNPKVAAAFEGIRPAIVALIVFAGFKIGKMAILDKTTLTVAAMTVVILLSIHIHPVLMIVSGGFAGIILVLVKEKIFGYENVVGKDGAAQKEEGYFMGDGI